MKRRSFVIGTAGMPFVSISKAFANEPCPPDILGAAPSPCETPTALPLGTLSQDTRTPEQLSLYLPVTGSVSQSAQATVEYRVAGTGSYLLAAPMWRIQPQYAPSTAPASVSDAFAGTIFDLVPGNDYEVRVSITEPGIGTDTKLGTFSTRALPPPARNPTTTVTTEPQLLAAIEAASPGDVIEISGTINLSGRVDIGDLSGGTHGTEQNPIYLRGNNRDTAVLNCPGSGLRALDANYWVLENFTLRGPGVDNGTSGGSAAFAFFSSSSELQGGQTGWTFRQMRIDGFDLGILNANYAVNDTLIYDCIIEGTNRWDQAHLEGNVAWNDDGIRIGGVGNCTWNCDIKDFGDAVSYRNQNVSDNFSVIGCFFYRNKIVNACDDAVEAEYCQRNCGFYDNYTLNSDTGCSVDGVFGGPYYHFRNRQINVGNQIIKNGESATGVLFWNNTFVATTGKAGTASGDRMWYLSQSAQLNDWEFRNNLLMWEGLGDILRFDEASGGWTPWVCTHNGWGRNGWNINYAGGGPKGGVADVNASLTPIHDNDVEITSQASVFGVPVVFGTDYLTEIDVEYDLRLRSGSEAAGRGIAIPNISPSDDIGAVRAGGVPTPVGNRYTG